MEKFIEPFLTSFLVTVILLFILIIVGKRVSWKKRQAFRHIHNKNVFRVGGVAMILGFNLALLFNSWLVVSPELWGVMFVSLLIMIFGFWDDVREVFWKAQLFFQISIAVFVFIVGVRIYYVTNPFNGGIINLDTGWGTIVAVILVIFWVVAVVNAMNWLDGIDALAGGVSWVAGLAIFILSLRPEVNQPPVAIISSAFLGAVLAFLIFNFYPSRAIAGTSGSVFMGFILAVLAIFSGTKIATAILVLALPLIDFTWVILERIRKGKSIFSPDKSHIHHKLLELGWSQRKISLSFFAVSLVIAFIALNTRMIGKSITLLLTVAVMLVVLFLVNRKLRDKQSV